MAAHAFGAEVYDSEFIHTIFDEQVGFASNIQSQYNKLLTSGFLEDNADVVFIKEMKGDSTLCWAKSVRSKPT